MIKIISKEAYSTFSVDIGEINFLYNLLSYLETLITVSD